MNKQDIVNKLMKEAGFSLEETIKFADALVGVIETALSQGEKIQIHGFGSFDVGGRRAHTGVHPRTGQRTEVPEIATARFHPSESLKKMVK